jgi:hypothetical protein
MSEYSISGVWEDELQGAAIKRIANSIHPQIQFYPVFSNRSKGPAGIGYIRSKWKGFYEASKGSPYLIMIDLDSNECAPSLRKEMGVPSNTMNFIFHIAVREIETWILADIRNFLAYFKIPSSISVKFPNNLEDIPDPKEFLISLIKHSTKREYIRAIVPESGSTARVGKYYNTYLIDFVQKRWDIDTARDKSESLRKFIDELKKLIVR